MLRPIKTPCSPGVELFLMTSNESMGSFGKLLVRNSKLGVFDSQQNGEGRSALRFGVLCHLKTYFNNESREIN